MSSRKQVVPPLGSAAAPAATGPGLRSGSSAAPAPAPAPVAPVYYHPPLVFSGGGPPLQESIVQPTGGAGGGGGYSVSPASSIHLEEDYDVEWEMSPYEDHPSTHHLNAFSASSQAQGSGGGGGYYYWQDNNNVNNNPEEGEEERGWQQQQQPQQQQRQTVPRLSLGHHHSQRHQNSLRHQRSRRNVTQSHHVAGGPLRSNPPWQQQQQQQPLDTRIGLSAPAVAVTTLSQQRERQNRNQQQQQQMVPPQVAEVRGVGAWGRAAGPPLAISNPNTYVPVHAPAQAPNGGNSSKKRTVPVVSASQIPRIFPDDTTAAPSLPAAVWPRGGGSGGQAPFMHYEDLDYFRPTAEQSRSGQPGREPEEAEVESEPLDDLQQQDVLQRQNDEREVLPTKESSFPPTPEGMVQMNRPKARHPWDRQRKKRWSKQKLSSVRGFESIVQVRDVNGQEEQQQQRGDDVRGGGKGGCGGGEYSNHYCLNWIPEMLWLLVSIVCFVGIVVVLWRFDGCSLRDWPLRVSINTLIAFLVAPCQIALAVPLTEGLAQLKWNWFARGERGLEDFQTFDNVSRGGPFGGLNLLFRRKGRALGMLAAVVLMTGFASSPLTQAAINYPTRLVTGSGTATAARSESYSSTATGNLDLQQKQAIQMAIYNPVDAKVPDVEPLCSSGECQWQNFSSLAVCVDVADISNQLVISQQARASTISASLGISGDDLVRTASLPNGVFLVGSPSSFNLNMSSPEINNPAQGGFLPLTASLAFANQDDKISSAIANAFIVYTNQTTATSTSGSNNTSVFRAVEVLWHFCVNTYQVATSQGVSTSRQVDSTILAPVSLNTAATTIFEERHSPPSLLGSETSRRTPRALLRERSEYSVNSADVRLLRNYIVSVFSGTYSLGYGGEAGGLTPTSEVLGTAMFGASVSSDGVSGVGTRSIVVEAEDSRLRAVIANLTQNVATSLTNTIRTMGPAETGIVLILDSYVSVQWAWLAFLAAQVTLSAVFLVGIMIQTAVWKVRILKASAMATLFAIPADGKMVLERRGLGSIDDDNSMTQRLESITGRFKLGDRGWKLDLGRSSHEVA
ncbi:hypothetical protein B0T17DRAFT_506582 [Bombardia bombarda]|uniref:Uncharacterized protein n=1 Tax=Bombardia bombarda TaxID=252184 RepID=A0AA39XAD2_9PEZI|nr:hypothetical protein B0T17DRAFT_506582 [Bombardia bombarda]